MKIKAKLAALALAVTCALTSCAQSTETLLPFHDPDELGSRFPQAIQAKTLYLIEPLSDFSENLLIASLQGLAAKNSDEQILITVSSTAYYLPYLTEKWGVTLSETIDEENVTLSALAKHYKNTVNGYILCSDVGGSESVNVAISLAGVLNAVIATESTKNILDELGYECVLDVTDKDDSWLRKSEYWLKLNRDIAIEQPNTSAPRLVDYAILSGAYFNFYKGKNMELHTVMFDFLNDNAIVLGWNNTLGERDTVISLSKINAQMIPADHATNLSTLSGFAVENISQKAVSDDSADAENVHTVCIIMSDGDNLQWTLGDYPTSTKWYGSEIRGTFDMGWGLLPSAVDLIAPTAVYLYDNATEKDEFITQLSGIGYTFPSLWESEYRQEMASQLAKYMSRSNSKFLEILDDGGFTEEIIKDFTKQNEIDGIFYIDYDDYAGMDGEVLWSNEKPVVSAKYRLWNGIEDGSIEYIAENINAASTDVSSPDSYSFIIVHSWSGLTDGELVPDGNTMDAVAELVSRFNENVEVVTPSEFMDRLIKNCK